MKFQYRNCGTLRKFDSVGDYLSYYTNFNCSDYGKGQIETMESKLEYLEDVLGRLLDALAPQLSLEQISEIVAGYDQNLELQDDE